MQSHKKLEFSLLKINGGLILITLLFGPSIPSMTPNSLELLIMNFAKSLSGKFGFESLTRSIHKNKPSPLISIILLGYLIFNLHKLSLR